MTNGGRHAAEPVTPGPRVLRPRQVSESRAPPAGATPPRAGRLTRSSTNAGGGSSAGRPTRSTGSSHSFATPDRKRSRHQSGFYDEDEDSDQDVFASSPASPPEPTPRSSRITRALRSSGPDIVKSITPTKRRAVSATSQRLPVKKATPVKSTPKRATPKRATPKSLPLAPPPSSRHIPWQSLPYFIWVDIFKYASSPLDDRNQVDWLLATSRICRAFAEPALTALYYCPPLLTKSMAHGLVQLLSREPSTTTFKYRAKVEKLRFDVEEIASKTYRGQPLDFRTLIASVPRLQVLDFTHTKDLPPFRTLDDSLRWQYPDALFEALNGFRLEQDAAPPTQLLGFRWNRRLMGADSTPARIKSLHLTPAFASLKKLSLVNYQVPSLRMAGREVTPELEALDHEYVGELAGAISALPKLEYLSVESSTGANSDFLALLPKCLKTLELVNCWEVKGEDFANYLLTHGHMLEHVTLRHNQSLSLAFLTVLGAACPNLQTLSVDLKTYNHHEFYHDSEPNYAEVLSKSQIPTWPESLERLELRNMKKWSAEAAELLFQSLVDNAPHLVHLRHLDLKAMLDIPFRQRSAIRDKWEAKLKRIFLRKLEDPQHFSSLQSRQTPAAHPPETTKKNPRKKARRNTGSESPARRSIRIAEHASNPVSRDSSVNRDLRGVRRPMYTEVDTDADDDDVQEASEESDKSDPGIGKDVGDDQEQEPRHGMCDTVVIQLDNQKIAEMEWQMDDFLDDERSDDESDEDWDGDQEPDDVVYAW